MENAIVRFAKLHQQKINKMKTVNQLIDIFLSSEIKTKKTRELLARLHDLKVISGGLTLVENTESVLNVLAAEKAKFFGKIKNIEYRKN
jgi:hypothetical protein